jgi:O-antigen/teichoic acid export membrane protein
MGLRRNFAFRLSTEVVMKLLGFTVTMLLARLFKPGLWGGMQWSLTTVGIFGTLADFGLGNIAAREIATSPEKHKGSWLVAAWLLKGLLWIAALLLFAVFHPGVPEGKSAEAFLLPAAFFSVGLSLGEFGSSLFSGLERLDLDFRVSIGSKLGQALAACLGAYGGWGPEKVMLAMGAMAWMGWIFFWIAVGRLVFSGTLHSLGSKLVSLLAGIWPFGLVSLLTHVYFNADSLIIGKILGLSAVGIYQSAYKCFSALGILPAAFNAAAFPMLMRSGHDAEGTAKRLKALKAIAGLGAAATVLLFGLGPWLPLVLGEAYQDSAPLLQALAWSCLFFFPNYVLINLLLAEHRQARVLYGAAIAVAFNLGGNFFAVARFGPLGAAWMTVFTEILILLAAALSLGSRFPFGAWSPWILRSAAVAALGCGLALLLKATGLWLLAPFLAPLAVLGLASWAGLLPASELQRAWDHLKSKKA